MSDFLWVEKYRPQTISDCILPPSMKATFQKFVDDESVPNLLLTGKAGVGKTTVAKAMLRELDSDYIVINGSLNGNIDTLRNEIQAFASTVSFHSGRKYVILDEADYLNPNSTQPALRNFIEEFSGNCGFIFTCNYPNRIIKELHSRCSVIDFKIPLEERPKLASLFYKRVVNILETEKVKFETKVVGELIKKFFPDWRRVLNELQRYSATGKIDSGILVSFSDESFKILLQAMRAKNFTEVRRWVGENSDIDQTTLFRKFYDYASDFAKPNSIPQLVLILADYQYKAAFVADNEINMAACFTEIMVEIEFK